VVAEVSMRMRLEVGWQSMAEEGVKVAMGADLWEALGYLRLP
jgi:hypothetical protein